MHTWSGEQTVTDCTPGSGLPQMLMEVLLPVLVMLVMLLLQSVLLLALLWLSTAITRLFSVGSAPAYTKWLVRWEFFVVDIFRSLTSEVFFWGFQYFRLHSSL